MISSSVLDYVQDTGGDYSKILLKLLNPESKIAWYCYTELLNILSVPMFDLVPCRIQPDVCGSAGLSKYSYWIFQTGACLVQLEANDQAIFPPLSLQDAGQQIIWPTGLVSTKRFAAL